MVINPKPTPSVAETKIGTKPVPAGTKRKTAYMAWTPNISSIWPGDSMAITSIKAYAVARHA